MIELKRISIFDENMEECIALEVLPEQLRKRERGNSTFYEGYCHT